MTYTQRTPRSGAGRRFELERFADLDELRPEWDALARASGNPFATTEWSEAWLAHSGQADEMRLFAAARPDGSVAAIVALVIVRGRYVRKARFLGFGAANELGPIAAAADRELAAQAVRAALVATRGDWDVFLGESLPGAGWALRLDGTMLAREASPVICGRWASWDAYLASRSRSLRKELRQKERRLQERGLRYRDVSAAGELGPAMDALFELHRARWGDEASPWFAGQEALHRAFAAVALERDWLRLRLLELDGRVVAANHSFRFGATEWSYQHGRDPAAEPDSVGLLVFSHAIRAALAEGATEFKLGPGRQDYKYRFATDDPGLEFVAAGRGLRGRAWLIATRSRAR